MLNIFKQNLDTIFLMEETSSDDQFQLNSETMIISDKEMNKLIESGKASKSVEIQGRKVENTEKLRQIGKYVYVMYENPKFTNEDDRILWVVKDRYNWKKGKKYQL